jgi:hypothetical protein
MILVTNNKIQTDKNIKRVQDKQRDTNKQKNFYFIFLKMKFDLQQIIIGNDFGIVTMIITKIPSYIN